MRVVIYTILSLLSLNAFSKEIISLTALISSPKTFHGKCLRVAGVLSVEFEGGRLYLDRESYTLKIHENAVRQPIMLDDEHQKLSEQLEGKWVRFTGRFNFETGALSPNGEFITFNNVEVIGQSDLVKFGESGECL